MSEKTLPIFFSDKYDLWFFGLEKLHSFDSHKWGRIMSFLFEKSQNHDGCINNSPVVITKESICEPPEATNEVLRCGHTEKYLNSLRWSYKVAQIFESWLVCIVPNFILDYLLLSHLRYQVNGTIMASRAAIANRKWAINIGGGFHHASEDKGQGFCVYADISLAIKILQKENPDRKFMIIDLDAHQGNGHERDFMEDNNVYIFDMYNESIYPRDEYAKRGINMKIPLISYTKDGEYNGILKEKLDLSFQDFEPDLIIYNSGTDSLKGDRLGRLGLSEDGIIERDEIVFKKAKDKKYPIVMLTSGGYQKNNAEIIANSILNLFRKDIIGGI